MAIDSEALAHPWGMIGQDSEVSALSRSIAQGRPAHAYLIVGPSQSGKGTLARRLAQALNCASPIERNGVVSPCGNCRSCRHIEEGKHPDVELIAPGGICGELEHDHRKDNSRDIKICQVRALERRLSLTPFEGKYRVIVIDPADALNVYAADAFLKTLEEPPPSVVLVLITAKEDALLETVRSRLRRVEVRPAPVSVLESTLVERGLDSTRAAVVARLALGRTGWALSVAADRVVLDERERLLDEIAALGSAGRFERFAFAADLGARWTRDRKGVTAVLSTWIGWWRDVALAAGGAERGILNVDRIDQIRTVARGLNAADAGRFVQYLCDARRQLEENANARLALEVLMLRLPEPRVSSA